MSELNWIKYPENIPALRECDQKNGEGFSERLIVLTDEGEIYDDVRFVTYRGGMFRTHAFGYDNDSWDVVNVTHFLYLESLILAIPRLPRNLK